MPLTALYDLPAPAKLNLFLHVVGRRADGYHLIESVFQLIDWADTLHVELQATGRLRRHDLGSPLPEDDLCLRAARALQSASGSTLGADISIDKRVPSGAGMGGGSSDAATVLLALNRLWQLRWPRERLLALAATLGADVPFFVFGRNALVQGIGEQLQPIELPAATYAVLKPEASLPTVEIFGSPALRRDTPSAIIAGSLESTAAAALASADGPAFGHNDLQAVAQARCAEVAQAIRRLDAEFGHGRMTGSGSAVFARVGAGASTPATWPEGSAMALPAGWVGRLCRSLARHPLCEWAG